MLLLALTTSAAAILPFRNPDLPRDGRAWDLIDRLNLTEKVYLLSSSARTVDRLGVHTMEGNECLHGLFNRFHNASGYFIDGAATIFPQSIGMSATWNRTLLHAMGEVISTETVAKRNSHRKDPLAATYGYPNYWTCWAPVINIARDTRWGRVPETYGEDGLLSRTLAAEVVKGIQGTDQRYLKVAASPKHFTAYDGPESNQPGSACGRFCMDAKVPPEDLDQTWLDHWEYVVKNSGTHPLSGVMCSYSALDGTPMCANSRMLTDKLRTEWGFSGWVVSDCGAISNIATDHHYVKTREEAGIAALTAGCDLECDSVYQTTLMNATLHGKISIAIIDRALYRIFYQQMTLGVYDPAGLNPYDAVNASVVDSPAHRQLAKVI
jgi:beta-glucosidase